MRPSLVLPTCTYRRYITQIDNVETYINHSGTSVAPCEPQWIRRGDNYNELMNSCYWNLFRVLLPYEANLLYHEYLPLRTKSMASDSQLNLNMDTVEISSIRKVYKQVSGFIVVDVGVDI